MRGLVAMTLCVALPLGCWHGQPTVEAPAPGPPVWVRTPKLKGPLFENPKMLSSFEERRLHYESTGTVQTVPPGGVWCGVDPLKLTAP